MVAVVIDDCAVFLLLAEEVVDREFSALVDSLPFAVVGSLCLGREGRRGKASGKQSGGKKKAKEYVKCALFGLACSTIHNYIPSERFLNSFAWLFGILRGSMYLPFRGSLLRRLLYGPS